MCATCGCAGDGAVIHLDDHGHGHGHGHEHDNGHERSHGQLIAPADSRTITLQRKVLAKNDDIAQRNRDWLAECGVFMLNLMSSPGAGKTTLLEHTGKDLADRLSIAVIEGDQETTLDAGRIRAAGIRVVQINTGAGCHLDAEMVARALTAIDPARGSIVIIENVGNLVCPALFDLGEASRVVLASVTEGADKPMKYPVMFRQADLVVVSKTDLLPYVDFDLERYAADMARISPAARLMQLSAVSGEGMNQWYDWLRLSLPGPG
ncbi:MAG TPA: hydrogenase nickel incorporation protein HypB [Streptosporangiaceae bacterium]|nr:hydrogenase nickel incorporation protein HypB [Streptosporangiaceae bacterium]